MSEYTEYYAVLLQAETLRDLRGQLEQGLDQADIMPFPIMASYGYEGVDRGVGAEEIWSLAEDLWTIQGGTDWVIVGTAENAIDSLAKLGPVVHIFVHEDDTRWYSEVRCDGQTVEFIVADQPWGDRWASGRFDALFAMGITDASTRLKKMAPCLGADAAALGVSLGLDGARYYLDALGIARLELYDQLLFSPETLGLTFDFEYLAD